MSDLIPVGSRAYKRKLRAERRVLGFLSDNEGKAYTPNQIADSQELPYHDVYLTLKRLVRDNYVSVKKKGSRKAYLYTP